MRNVVYILLLFLSGCQSNGQYAIQGYLPDQTYDGEFIYLVPFENAVKVRVDSAIIQDGKFRIEGVVKKADIYIIRAKPLLRLQLQELLVVKEPGELTVSIGNNSLVGGTALNDSLQRWKEKKLEADQLFEELKQQYQSLDDNTQKAKVKLAADAITNRAREFNYQFARNNKNNVVGKLVFQIMGSSFSTEQKMSLTRK